MLTHRPARSVQDGPDGELAWSHARRAQLVTLGIWAHYDGMESRVWTH
jgi:hypothetical protein